MPTEYGGAGLSHVDGTLITEEWCEFLKENRFLVGLSIDGPRDVHDHYRVNKGGAPTFDKVMAAARLLHRLRLHPRQLLRRRLRHP